MKVHLVDGTFELFRCFHGAPSAKSPEGVEVGAVRGLLHTLVALLRQEDVTHVAVAVDQAVGSDEDDLTRQHGLAAEAIRALGLVIWPMVKRFQADDALATGAARFKESVDQVVICTPDKDLAQCVEGTRVVLLDRVRKKVIDEPGVLEKFGIEPASIPDLLALAGDPQDGLPGLPGFGRKTAAALLRKHKKIEAIPLDPQDWEIRGAERLARTLRERMKEALLYRELTTLARDVPFSHRLEDLKWPGAERAELVRFAESLGEVDVLERVPRWREG